MRDAKKHGLNTYEEIILKKLQKTYESNWMSIKSRAKDSIYEIRWMDKTEKRCYDAQERAFWNRVKPLTGQPSQKSEECHKKANLPTHERQEFTELENNLEGEALAEFLEACVSDSVSALTLPRVKVSAASKRYVNQDDKNRARANKLCSHDNSFYSAWLPDAIL
jgi:hypothetical protein